MLKILLFLAPILLEMLKTLLTIPKERSKKWLCTSQLEENWDKSQYCDAEYFTNNFLVSFTFHYLFCYFDWFVRK